MTIDDGGEITLEYKESELTGMEGTNTRFTVKPDEVELTRTGYQMQHIYRAINSDMSRLMIAIRGQ